MDFLAYLLSGELITVNASANNLSIMKVFTDYGEASEFARDILNKNPGANISLFIGQGVSNEKILKHYL